MATTFATAPIRKLRIAGKDLRFYTEVAEGAPATAVHRAGGNIAPQSFLE